MNAPTMICNAARHRRSLFEPLMTADQSRQPQTFVLRAEVVDTSHKVHA